MDTTVQKTPQEWIKEGITFTIPDLPYWWVFGRYRFPRVHVALFDKLAQQFGITRLGIEHHVGARRVFSTGSLGEYYFPELHHAYTSVHGFNRPHSERRLIAWQSIARKLFFRHVQKVLRAYSGNPLTMIEVMIREAKKRDCSLLVIHANDLSAIHSALVNNDITSPSSVDASIRGGSPKDSLVLLYPTLQYLQKLGEKNNMRWAIENVVPPRYSPTFSVYENPFALAQVVGDYSHIGVTIDTAHLMITRQLYLNKNLLPTASELFREVLKLGKLWNVHCVGYCYKGLEPYEGVAAHVSEEPDEFKKIFSLLYEYGYAGQIVLELSTLRGGVDLLDFVVSCLGNFIAGPKYSKEVTRHVHDVGMICEAVGATTNIKK